MKRRRFLHKDDPSACDLVNKSDLALFRAISTNPNHVLHNYLPSPKQHKYHLRAIVHSFSLPLKGVRNFIPGAYTETYTNPLLTLVYVPTPSFYSIHFINWCAKGIFSFSQDCFLLSGSLALKALLIGVLYCIVFIHLYSASHSLSLSEALPTTAIDTMSEFTHRSATGNCR